MSQRLTLLLVFGHPEDETIGAGGVMARYAAEGIRVVCVTCTKGEAGEIVAPELDTPENRARLGEIRQEEIARALTHLGPIEHHWLGYRDSGMMDTADNDDPRSFWQADLDEAVGRLVRIVREVRPHVVLSSNVHGEYGHPDHIRAAQIAMEAYKRAGDPVCYPEQLAGPGALEPWSPAKLYGLAPQLDRREKLSRLLADRGYVRSIPVIARAALRWRPGRERERALMASGEAAASTRVDVGDWLQSKQDALLEHATQVAPDNFYLTLTVDERRVVAPTEDFTLRAARIAVTLPEDDLFAGFRG